ncbi:hypothetical protein MMC12_000611 [Toensbergia leucococca]|nr:hypothetical protein [Toensbergia leucococca]
MDRVAPGATLVRTETGIKVMDGDEVEEVEFVVEEENDSGETEAENDSRETEEEAETDEEGKQKQG